MAFSDRGPTDNRGAKSDPRDQTKTDIGPNSGSPNAADLDRSLNPDAEIIEQQIGPGLRSMYSNILNESLPEDLLAVVDAMASKEKRSLPSNPKDGPHREAKAADQSFTSEGGSSDD